MVESVNSKSEDSMFAVSLLTPWIKGSMDVHGNFLQIDMPNTVFFGLIPAGKEKDSTPLQGVTNVYTSNSYKMGAIILGGLIGLTGLGMLATSPIGGIIVAVIGGAILCGGIKTQFSYERSGIIKTINVPFFEADKVRTFEQKVINQLSGFQDDRNVRVQTEKSMAQSRENTQAIVNAVSGDTSASQTSSQTAETSNVSGNGQATVKFCPNCGTKVVPGNKFCTNCGAKLG